MQNPARAASALSSALNSSTPKPSAGSHIQQPSTARTVSSADAQPAPIMRRLWQRMTEIYGHRWTSAYGEDAAGSAGKTWARGLSGVAPAQIAAGLEEALVSADDWPPTLPRFRAMCMGIPPLAAVRANIAGGAAIRDRFAALVWQNLDAYRWRNADAETADRLLRDAYEVAKERVMRGEELPPAPVAAIAAEPPKPRRPASNEVVNGALAKIAELFAQTPGGEPPAVDIAAAEAGLAAHYGSRTP